MGRGNKSIGKMFSEHADVEPKNVKIRSFVVREPCERCVTSFEKEMWNQIIAGYIIETRGSTT